MSFKEISLALGKHYTGRRSLHTMHSAVTGTSNGPKAIPNVQK